MKIQQTFNNEQLISITDIETGGLVVLLGCLFAIGLLVF